MKHGMTIEYLKCRADLNFEVDFGENDLIGRILSNWDLISSDNGLFSSIILLFFKYASYAFNAVNLFLFTECADYSG